MVFRHFILTPKIDVENIKYTLKVIGGIHYIIYGGAVRNKVSVTHDRELII